MTLPPTRTRKIRDVLTAEEIAALRRPSDLRGALAVGTTWAVIAATFAMVAAWPGPLTVVAALLLLGGRHLALAVLMHEAAHRSLFASRRLGEWVGHWLCAAPSGNRLAAYREHHLGHHAHAGSERDPDRALVEPFPTSRASMVRKLARDLFGRTGLRRVVGIALMDLGVLAYDVSGKPERNGPEHRRPAVMARAFVRNAGPTILTNVVLLGTLAAAGHAWLYLLWVGSYLTTYSVVLRLRSIAEHACTDDGSSVFAHTRTVMVGPLTRLFVAPHHVNYHLEHHLLPTVPYYALPKLSRMLRTRGAYEGAHVTRGYLRVLDRASAA